MPISLERADGLQVVVRRGELTLSRDGESRTERWPSAEDLAERLRALGFTPEDIAETY